MVACGTNTGAWLMYLSNSYIVCKWKKDKKIVKVWSFVGVCIWRKKFNTEINISNLTASMKGIFSLSASLGVSFPIASSTSRWSRFCNSGLLVRMATKACVALKVVALPTKSQYFFLCTFFELHPFDKIVLEVREQRYSKYKRPNYLPFLIVICNISIAQWLQCLNSSFLIRVDGT